LLTDSSRLSAWIELCQQAAQAVLARHGWTLLDEVTLAGKAADLLADLAAPTRLQAERACQQVYAQTLYAAAHDPARQELAYRELHAYLYRIAQRQRPHLAEDAAQEAIQLLYQNILTCRDPAAFLKFAIYQLLTAFHRLTPPREEPSLDSLLEVPDEIGAAIELPGNGSDPETEVEERQMTAELLQWLRDVIEANPRARKQLLAVAMKYLEEWDDEEIAAALGTTVANVHVLRSRGLAKLRAEYRKRPPSARFSAAGHPDE
jgi:RNA polymerase sigma factor (sigma-70 family)